MRDKPLEILVFGTGAVGSIFGWRVSRNTNVRLSVICRSNYEVVKRQGLRFRTVLWGDGAVYPNRIARHPHELQHVDFDYVVCANKSIPQQATVVAESLRPVVREHTSLGILQNGVGVENALRNVFPSNTILSSVCYVSCRQSSMGIIDQVSQLNPHAFVIGTFPRSSTTATDDQERLEQLVGLDSSFRAVEDIIAERWNKMIFNGAWNPATAIMGLDTHQMIENSPVGLELVRSLAREVGMIGRSNGVQLPQNVEELIIATAAAAPAIVPSMLQDAMKHKQMEVEAICGTLCRMARSFGLRVPTIQAVYNRLSQMNQTFLEEAYSVGRKDIGHLGGLHDHQNLVGLVKAAL